MYDIDDSYVAYCFDEAVGAFGNYVKGELSQVEGKTQSEIEGRQMLILKGLLSDNPAERFAAPASPKNRNDG